MSGRTVTIFSGKDGVFIQHLANQLENEGIKSMIKGEVSSRVFGIENTTQMIELIVFEKDAVRAVELIKELTK